MRDLDRRTFLRIAGASLGAIPFDPAHPFRNLGMCVVRAAPGQRPTTGPTTATVRPEEVELTMAEHSGTEGFAQILRPSSL